MHFLQLLEGSLYKSFWSKLGSYSSIGDCKLSFKLVNVSFKDSVISSKLIANYCKSSTRIFLSILVKREIYTKALAGMLFFILLKCFGSKQIQSLSNFELFKNLLSKLFKKNIMNTIISFNFKQTVNWYNEFICNYII